jgi:hypothetical protein
MLQFPGKWRYRTSADRTTNLPPRSTFPQTPFFGPNASDSVACLPDPAVGDEQNLDRPYLPNHLQQTAEPILELLPAK